MNYLGNNVWSLGAWNVIGSDDDKSFDLWLFVWHGCDDDPNKAMKHIGNFPSLCDVENFLRMKAKVNFDD